jgi:hypothetical protein
MNNANLLPTLARLTSNASYVIASLIYYLKQQRGVEEITEPTFELKTEKEWALELATLTPEEITTIASLVNLLKAPTPTLSSSATYITTAAISSLQQEEAAPYITTPTPSLKTGEEWAKELATLSPQNITKTTSLIKYVLEPKTFAPQNLAVSAVTGISPLASDIKKILYPTSPTPMRFAAEIAAVEKQAAIDKPPAPTPPPPPPKPAVPPELTIKRTHYPKWWNDEGVEKISLTSPGSQFIVTARGDYSLYIGTIVLTVSGECDIIFTFGQAGTSGSMNFGGENEPRGIVIAMGNSPMPCGSGSLMITATSDEAVNIGGFVSYYLWKKET